MDYAYCMVRCKGGIPFRVIKINKIISQQLTSCIWVMFRNAFAQCYEFSLRNISRWLLFCFQSKHASRRWMTLCICSMSSSSHLEPFRHKRKDLRCSEHIVVSIIPNGEVLTIALWLCWAQWTFAVGGTVGLICLVSWFMGWDLRASHASGNIPIKCSRSFFQFA